MVCAPPAFAPAMMNPFQLWQDMLQAGMKSWQPQPASQPAVPANSLQVMQDQFQQGFALWQKMLMPQSAPMQPGVMAPKITVTTIELGDIRPYLDMAAQMMTTMQPMMQNAMQVGMNGMMTQLLRGRS